MCERMEINGVEKLVPNLRDKKNYVIHIQALNQALQHGLRLDRIYRSIEFDQSPWLKTYMDFNTQLRTAGLEKLKLCYMDTVSLVYDIKTEDFCENIADDGYSKTDFRPLPISLNNRTHER